MKSAKKKSFPKASPKTASRHKKRLRAEKTGCLKDIIGTVSKSSAPQKKTYEVGSIAAAAITAAAAVGGLIATIRKK